MRSILLAGLVVVVTTGCAASSKSESTVSGTLALQGFPSAPTHVAATDERGVVRRAPVGTDGHFSVTVPKGHRYVLSIDGVPVVFPRTSGQLDRSFAIGFAFRQGFLLTESSVYPSYTTLGLRAEYVLGW